MPVTGAGWGFSGHGWDEVGGGSSLSWQRGIPDGERTTKVAPFATSIERQGSREDPRFARRGATRWDNSRQFSAWKFGRELVKRE